MSSNSPLIPRSATESAATGSELTFSPIKKYKFGFILSTALGNMTRYANFKKFAERDNEVDFVWAPVKHYFSAQETNPFELLPRFLQSRAIVIYQSAPVLKCFSSFDAVMIHLYELDVLTALRGYIAHRPVRVISSDTAPAIDPSRYPFHPDELEKPAWRRTVRLKIDLWRSRRADLLIPFSNWAGDLLVNGAGVSKEIVKPIHVGLDLSVWRFHERPQRPKESRTRILFVGGEFFRKGGADLLTVFKTRFMDSSELHIVTKTVLNDLPSHVYVYSDMNANDVRLADLYHFADILVHPTRSDLSSWVVLEAMASGCAVVTTPVGGIPDLVSDPDTGLLVSPGNLGALAEAIESLVNDPERRRKMTMRARKAVEEQFNAELNVPLILKAMKDAVRDSEVRSERRRWF